MLGASLITASTCPLTTTGYRSDRRIGRSRSVEAEHRKERLVDTPHLLVREVTALSTQPGGIYRTDLLDQNLRALTADLDLGTE